MNFRNLLKLSDGAKTHIQGPFRYSETLIQGHSDWESQARYSSKYLELRMRLRKGPLSCRHLRGCPLIRPELRGRRPSAEPCREGALFGLCLLWVRQMPGKIWRDPGGGCVQAAPVLAAPSLGTRLYPRRWTWSQPSTSPRGQARDLPSLPAIPEPTVLRRSTNRGPSAQSLGSSG